MARWLLIPRTRSLLLAAAAIAAGSGFSDGQAATAASAAFLPHQALYELSLVKSRGSASIENARGRILYDFSGSACEGYTSEFRQVSELSSGEGKVTLSDLRSTSWEDADGKSYKFKIDTRMNDSDASPVDGIAERTGDHITAAKDGKSLLELTVYDGSDNGEKVYNTLTVIGAPIPGDRAVASPDPATTSDAMKSLTRWPVTVSYYDRDAKAKDGEQTPVYAMSFELAENGVSRALVLDYNDFVISGALGKFDVKDAKPCK